MTASAVGAEDLDGMRATLATGNRGARAEPAGLAPRRQPFPREASSVPESPAQVVGPPAEDACNAGQARYDGRAPTTT